jgi:hypothetical protein
LQSRSDLFLQISENTQPLQYPNKTWTPLETFAQYRTAVVPARIEELLRTSCRLAPDCAESENATQLFFVCGIYAA